MRLTGTDFWGEPLDWRGAIDLLRKAAELGVNFFDTADFYGPGKLDLTYFMEKHFMFNLTMDKFGHLTGRSLNTFKRDFQKAFQTTPHKWLTQKRLELAHYQLTEK